MNEYFVEFSHADGLILLLSKIILIVPSVLVALLVFVVIGLYMFDVFVLPMRTVDVLVAWYLPHYTRHALQTFVSFVTDIFGYGLNGFVGVTYASNYFCILHLFITDSIEKPPYYLIALDIHKWISQEFGTHLRFYLSPLNNSGFLLCTIRRVELLAVDPVHTSSTFLCILVLRACLCSINNIL